MSAESNAVPKEVAMDKAYEPLKVEDGIYAAWEKSGMFNPDKLPGKRTKAFTIMMPPPNRTGILHVGHATGIALQDLMIRFERMRGKKTLWLPGTDHAAIATQVKVEELLIKQGMKNPRAELGREGFLAKVVEFAEQSGKTIVQQTRKMGASCDWSREAYTFDVPRNRAVNTMFAMMYQDGLLERGYRVVNWDPQFQTTLSDDEVLTKEVTAKFLTFTYDKDFPIVISTTRPETKFGDVAVAVHPEDKRYAKFVGKTFTPTFCGKKLSITVVADEAVDPKFGTGALGVTPAHSMIDAEMAERHGLKTVQVIGPDGRMNAEAGAGFSGLTVVEARAKIEASLQADGLLQKVEEIAQNLPVAERGGAPVEQLPMRQWFVRVNKKFALRQPTLGKWKKGDKVTLKQLMHAAVASGQTNIMPEQSRKVYFHWIDNLRDWCISRQIWFGHRVPAWYCDACDREKAIVSAEAPKKCPACGGKTLRQDEDTLDTWFSSGTWTFSTLGWPPSAKASGGRPDKTKDLKTFHPTDVLETGRDIIFFWVARMVLMSSYALGTVPFKTVYLHGLVRDEQGRKMSKSLGNIIDPLDVSAKYGTDAVRLSLVIGGTAGNDTRISDEKIAGYRNFTNKLWNVARFIAMSAPKLKSQKGKPTPKTLADKWILARLDATTAAVTKSLTAMQFSHAGETLRDFTWNELADWYLEVAKIEGQAEGGKGRKDAMLAYILRTVLALWHPFMPYVTEEIWQRLFAKGEKDLLMVATWPKGKEAKVGAAERDFEVIRETVGAIRGIRAQYKVEPGKRIDVTLTSAKHAKLLSAHAMVISTLARIEQLTVSTKAYKGTPFPQGFGGHSKTATAVVKGVTVNVPLGSLVDLEVEKKRLAEELAQAEKYAMSLEGKLGNADFIARAPAQVVAGEREKLAATKEKVAKLREQIAGM